MPAGWKKIGRAAGWGVGLGLTAALAVEGGSIFLGRNWHAVIPGQAYRCAQLSYDQLVDSVRGSGVKTVVNLRGTAPDLDWYVAESRATRDTDICQEDITLSAYRLPAPDELRRLVDVIDHATYPVLLHCRQGVDRTGLASAILMLLRTDATPTRRGGNRPRATATSRSARPGASRVPGPVRRLARASGPAAFAGGLARMGRPRLLSGASRGHLELVGRRPGYPSASRRRFTSEPSTRRSGRGISIPERRQGFTSGFWSMGRMRSLGMSAGRGSSKPRCHQTGRWI